MGFQFIQPRPAPSKLKTGNVLMARCEVVGWVGFRWVRFGPGWGVLGVLYSLAKKWRHTMLLLCLYFCPRIVNTVQEKLHKKPNSPRHLLQLTNTEIYTKRVSMVIVHGWEAVHFSHHIKHYIHYSM